MYSYWIISMYLSFSNMYVSYRHLHKCIQISFLHYVEKNKNRKIMSFKIYIHAYDFLFAF